MIKKGGIVLGSAQKPLECPWVRFYCSNFQGCWPVCVWSFFYLAAHFCGRWIPLEGNIILMVMLQKDHVMGDDI